MTFDPEVRQIRDQREKTNRNDRHGHERSIGFPSHEVIERQRNDGKIEKESGPPERTVFLEVRQGQHDRRRCSKECVVPAERGDKRDEAQQEEALKKRRPGDGFSSGQEKKEEKTEAGQSEKIEKE